MEQSSMHLQGLMQNGQGAQSSDSAVGFTAVSAYAPCNSNASRNPECGVSVPPLSHSQDITSDWLTKALQVWNRAIPEVIGFTVSPFAETDYDFTLRLALSYANARSDTRLGPTSVLCKISRPLLATQWNAEPRWSEFVVDACRRETAAYLELKYHDVCRMPTLLFSAMDAHRFTFLLHEDSGALPVNRYAVDQQAPNQRAQIEAVLRELALLHGSFSRHSPVSAPQWLLRPRDVAELIGERYRDGLSFLLASDCGNSLSAEHRQVMVEFASRIVAWHEFERHILTVTHGDMHADNMLYQVEGSFCRATLVGWKLAGLRNPMFDVASLLSNSLAVKDRRDSEASLLERYRRQFEQSGTTYAVVDACDDYRFHLFAPLILNVCAAVFLGQSANRNNLLIDTIARNCQAVIDWNALNSLATRLSTV